MRSLNFGEDIIESLKLFLTERFAHLLVGVHLTWKILEYGVSQADIISPFILIIAVEILMINLRRLETYTLFVKGGGLNQPPPLGIFVIAT